MASFYDQNHESNHKNSMAGQSVLVDLEGGDKVQIYVYTDTGLQVGQHNCCISNSRKMTQLFVLRISRAIN